MTPHMFAGIVCSKSQSLLLDKLGKADGAAAAARHMPCRLLHDHKALPANLVMHPGTLGRRLHI